MDSTLRAAAAPTWRAFLRLRQQRLAIDGAHRHRLRIQLAATLALMGLDAVIIVGAAVGQGFIP